MRILLEITVIIIVLLSNHRSIAYFELIEELGCHDTEFRLSCSSLNANIAIFEATFSQNDTFLEPVHTSCGYPGNPPNKNSWKIYKLKDWEKKFYHHTYQNEVIEVNFKHAINRRCSGVNYCSFMLKEDYEAGPRLGPGAVYLRYACVDDIHITRACNANIDVSFEGFVRTPGYPSYYIGETSCLWTLKAFPPQRVKVTFLDVSLREIGPHEGNCLDWLIVSEDGLNLLSTCGDILEDTLILSDGSSLNVTFKTSSKTLYPKRGLLFHYKAVGCPFLRKPQDGYLINRNETFAHFRCCVGFIFPDTMTRDKVLKCYNENTWDGDVLDCVNTTEATIEEINSNEIYIGNLTVEVRSSRETMEATDSIKDIVVPSIIMCILFIVNGIVLYIIYRHRKRKGMTKPAVFSPMNAPVFKHKIVRRSFNGAENDKHRLEEKKLPD